MTRRYSSTKLLLLLVFLLFTSLLWSCGGGGGGTSMTLSGSSGGTGSAALLIADGPADDYDHLWIWISRVTLLPEDGSGLNPVVLFRSNRPEGYQADLLDLRDQDLLVTVKDHIPAGTYSKIRLEIIDIQAEDFDNSAPCDQIEIKLPSGKIDLNPRGGITIRAGETLAIRLDIDANKSIQLHDAGNSGKCIFRPVVFVEIEPVFVPDRCPRLLKGTIGRLYVENDATVGFELILGDGRSPLRVNIDGQTVIFDENATLIGAEAFVPGYPVNVRGYLDGEGELLASMIVIGDVIELKGMVTEAVSGDMFIVDLSPNQFIISDALNVALAQASAIFTGCDTPVGQDFIQAGMGVRLFGKLDLTNEVHVFRAVAVFLSPATLTGSITYVEAPTSETMRSITLDDNIQIEVPDDVTPYLVGDGDVPWELIESVVACGPQARVTLVPGAGENTAAAIDILPKAVDATIESISLGDRRIVTSSGQTIYVQPGAFIVMSTSGADIPVSLSSFEIGDTIRVHGIEGCGATNFYGFILFRVMT